jgi:D-beta-D-heptose 7-phosphate kinase/D-beta-D-heptose 1-phosphate adenosyltransferase
MTARTNPPSGSAFGAPPVLSYSQVREILQAVRGVRLLVAGDLICDHYVWGRADRLSREAPVQVLRVEREEFRLGGAGNAAANAAALGARTALCAVTGRDRHARTLRTLLAGHSISTRALYSSPARRTTLKTRVVAQRQQVVRLDEEDDAPLSAAEERQVWVRMRRQLRRADALLLSDYERGMLTPSLIQRAMREAARMGIPVVVDPKKSDFSAYRGAEALTPNTQEAESASGLAVRNREDALKAARKIQRRAAAACVLLTLGSGGMLLLHRGRAVHIPAWRREVFDVTGAGDTVAALFASMLAAGRGPAESAAVANAAAGIVVGKFGAASVHPEEVLSAFMDAQAGGKDLSLEQAVQKAAVLRREGKKLVFTNGCFDLLHPGHVAYLQEARSLGDALFVGLNSDASVRRLKGGGRPVRPLGERLKMLGALACVDGVLVFDEDTPLRLIRGLRPDVLVKGGDYRGRRWAVVGSREVERWGGKVALTRRYGRHSTSALIKHIRGRSL